MSANVAQQEWWSDRKHKLGLKLDDPVLTKDRRGTTGVSDLLCRFGRSFLTRKDKVCDGSSDRSSQSGTAHMLTANENRDTWQCLGCGQL